MKKKLIIDYGYDFDLLGIISPAKDYKLAWTLNNILGIKLIKFPDLKIEFINDKHLIISNYIFETENSKFKLLKNKALEIEEGSISYLLPELKNFDYFIMLEDQAEAFSELHVLQKIKEASLIQYVAKIDTAKLKSKENLIF